MAKATGGSMTTLQELSMKEIFEIRDALEILNKYGYASEELRLQVWAEIEYLKDGGER